VKTVVLRSSTHVLTVDSLLVGIVLCQDNPRALPRTLFITLFTSHGCGEMIYRVYVALLVSRSDNESSISLRMRAKKQSMKSRPTVGCCRSERTAPTIFAVDTDVNARELCTRHSVVVLTWLFVGAEHNWNLPVPVPAEEGPVPVPLLGLGPVQRFSRTSPQVPSRTSPP
jgi:hypothetical protein